MASMNLESRQGHGPSTRGTMKDPRRTNRLKVSQMAMILILVALFGIAVHWFISLLPAIQANTLALRLWIKELRSTWLTPSMWFVVLHLILAIIAASSGWLSRPSEDQSGRAEAFKIYVGPLQPGLNQDDLFVSDKRAGDEHIDAIENDVVTDSLEGSLQEEGENIVGHPRLQKSLTLPSRNASYEEVETSESKFKTGAQHKRAKSAVVLEEPHSVLWGKPHFAKEESVDRGRRVKLSPLEIPTPMVVMGTVKEAWVQVTVAESPPHKQTHPTSAGSVSLPKESLSSTYDPVSPAEVVSSLSAEEAAPLIASVSFNEASPVAAVSSDPNKPVSPRKGRSAPTTPPAVLSLVDDQQTLQHSLSAQQAMESSKLVTDQGEEPEADILHVTRSLTKPIVADQHTDENDENGNEADLKQEKEQISEISEQEEAASQDDLHEQIEAFLANFHKQIRLQRQESMIRYKKILDSAD